jgi:hypothetical protein
MRGAPNDNNVRLTKHQLAEICEQLGQDELTFLTQTAVQGGVRIELVDDLPQEPYYFLCDLEWHSANFGVKKETNCRLCGQLCYHQSPINEFTVTICTMCYATQTLPDDPANLESFWTETPSVAKMFGIYAGQVFRDPALILSSAWGAYLAHPAANKIIEMGDEVIPFIMKHYERYGCGWDAFLYIMVPEEEWPTLAEEHRGMVPEIRNMWLQWGVDHGHIESFNPEFPIEAWRRFVNHNDTLTIDSEEPDGTEDKDKPE